MKVQDQQMFQKKIQSIINVERKAWIKTSESEVQMTEEELKLWQKCQRGRVKVDCHNESSIEDRESNYIEI